MHNRRARPTLRLLRDDLTDGWAQPWPRRALAVGDLFSLHPVSELPHPIVAKAVECFGANPDDDIHRGVIRESTKLPLLEIRTSQWRGGVWEDHATGVCWLLIAGLAKGGHEDYEDLYERIKRETAVGGQRRWLPSDEDHRLLRQETAARLLTEWELAVQREVLGALRAVLDGGSTRVEVLHPRPEKGMLARLSLAVTPVREQDYECDEIELEVVPAPGYAGSDLLWQLTVQVLICLSPPEQDWDRYKDSYTNIAEPGSWTTRVFELEKLVATGELAESEPGSHSHYTHREHLAGSTVEGHAVRALCGAFFVPRQDHESLPVCQNCEDRRAEVEPTL